MNNIALVIFAIILWVCCYKWIISIDYDGEDIPAKWIQIFYLFFWPGIVILRVGQLLSDVLFDV